MAEFEKPQIIVHIHKSLNYTVFDTKWIPSSAKVAVLGSRPRGTGALQIYEIEKGELKLVKEVRYLTEINVWLSLGKLLEFKKSSLIPTTIQFYGILGLYT